MLRYAMLLGLMLLLPAGFSFAQDGADSTTPTAEPPADPFQPATDPRAPNISEEDKKYPELAEAKKLYAAKDVKGSLAGLEKAAKKYPELPPAKVMLGTIHLRANNAASGKAAFDEAARENPNHPEPYLALADLAIREGRFTDAAMLVERAIKNTAAFKGDAEKIKTLKMRCYAVLVPISQRWKDWAQAKSDVDKWLALEAENAVALYRLGEVLFHQGKRREAFEKLKEAREQDKGIPNPAVVMGRLFLAAEDAAQAKKWMNYAADNAGEDNKLKLGVARWHWGQSNIDDARKQADAVLENDPHSIDAKYLRGLIAFYNRDYNNARDKFESLLLQKSNHLGANIHLALSLLEQNTEASRQASLELAQRMLRAASNNAGVVATVGWIYYRTGKHEQAERLYSTLNARNMSREAAYYIARLQEGRGKKEEAKRLLELAMQNDQPFIYRKAAEALLDRLQ